MHYYVRHGIDDLLEVYCDSSSDSPNIVLLPVTGIIFNRCNVGESGVKRTHGARMNSPISLK